MATSGSAGSLAQCSSTSTGPTDPTEASNDDIYDLVMHVAAHPIEVDKLAQRLRAIVNTNA
jgi:hypothetical protein